MGKQKKAEEKDKQVSLLRSTDFSPYCFTVKQKGLKKKGAKLITSAISTTTLVFVQKLC